MSDFPFADMLPVGVCRFADLADGLLPCRAAARLPQNAASVIVYLFPYWLGEEAYRGANVSKYAVPADYHTVAGDYLARAAAALKARWPENEFVPFCDNSPLPEVRATVLAGLGAKGRNGLLLNETYGSYCFIGEIVTDRVLPAYDGPPKTCLNCGLCERACPTGALHDGTVDKALCLSDVSQRKTEPTPEQRELMRKTGCVWGCDVCQDVCPVNRNLPLTPVPEFRESARAVFHAGDPIEGRAYAWRGRAVIDRNAALTGEPSEKE